MQVPILVEPMTVGGGYVAKTGSPFDFVMERSTVLEAIDTLEAMIRDRLAKGAQVFKIDIGPKLTRIRSTDGLPDDELTREWRAAIEEYRRECDEQMRQELDEMQELERQTA